jgi:hypothetical protein
MMILEKLVSVILVSYIYAMDERLVHRREVLRVFVRSAMYERCAGGYLFSHDRFDSFCAQK